MIRFIPKFGLRKGIFNSIFLAVSAFCNAGFDNFGNDSLLGLQTDVLVNITLALLIITGGLGFMVWFDLATKLGGKQKGLHFHTKVVLLLTAGLLVFGTVTSLWTEYNNPGTIGNLSFGDKLLVSFFQRLYGCSSSNTVYLSASDVSRRGSGWYSGRSENYDLLSSFAFCPKGNSGLASYQYGAENAVSSASAEGFWCDSDFSADISARTFSTGASDR